MPQSEPKKPDATLEMSDLIDTSQPVSDDLSMPYSDSHTAHNENTPSVYPNTLGESQATVVTPNPAPALTHPVMPEQNAPPTINQEPVTAFEGVSAPVFHNPQAAAMTSHLEEFGASTLPVAQITPTAVKMNLAPHYDTFAAHGGTDKADEPATTLFGKLALTLRLNKIFSRHNLKYAGIGLASFGIFLLVFNFQTISVQFGYFLNPPKPSAPVAATSPVVSAEPVVANLAEAAPPGNVISIPKIKVASVPIVLEPTINEAAIQKSLQSGVVHYAGTALPGEKSNIVIVGHSSNDWWEPGNYKFIFALLEKMVVGDQIQVNYQQKKYVYEVTGTKVVEPTEISVLQPTSEPQLTLITCTPPGTSWKRLVVVAKQVSPLPNPPQTAEKSTSPAANTKIEAALPGNAPSFLDQVKRWLGFS